MLFYFLEIYFMFADGKKLYGFTVGDDALVTLKTIKKKIYLSSSHDFIKSIFDCSQIIWPIGSMFGIKSFRWATLLLRKRFAF